MKITPRHSAEAGADPMLYAATAPGVVQGGYYGPRFGLIGAPAVTTLSRRDRTRTSQHACGSPPNC